ncbi:MAG: hypothetical protein ABIR17_04140 [Pseudolysinimonas sp.]|uniref:DUF7937 domain-containing protein n=1 Tax=Pseudolysinimonas sp. TaxID=2680009 RepID=UPI0032674584
MTTPLTMSRTSPFAGIPISDFLRDAFAATLLLVSFAMAWNSTGDATAHIEVILITLLSVFSLSITYLARAGVLPPTATVRTVWLIRVLANLPYLVLVVVYVIIDAISASGSVPGGIGFAMTFGLAGAIIAAQPRQAEVKALQHGSAIGETWYRIVVGFGIVGLLLVVVNLVLILVSILPQLSYFGSPLYVVIVLIGSFFYLGALGALFAGMLLRSEAGRLTALAIGVSALGAVLIDVFSQRVLSSGGLESLTTPVFGVLIFGSLAALASAPPVKLAMRPVDPLTAWVRAASNLLIATAVLALYTTLITILTLIVLASTGRDFGFTGFGIGIIVVTVLMALAAIVGRSLLAGNQPSARVLVLGISGLLLVLGIVFVVIATNAGQSLGSVGARIGIPDLVLAFGLPIAIASFLTIPASVRAHYGSLFGAMGAPRSYSDLIDQVAATETVAPIHADTAAPPTVYTAAQASDPATSASVLFQIAQAQPELRRNIAANPSTYQGLLDWLGALGDPEVDAALKAR